MINNWSRIIYPTMNAIMALFFLVLSGSLWAIPPRIIINGGFEIPNIGTQCSSGFANSDVVDGWDTTHSSGSYNGCGDLIGRPIEMWVDGTLGFDARVSGSQFVELNAYEASFLYQNICMIAGESVDYEYYHRRRALTGNEITKARLRSTSNPSTIINESSDHIANTGTWQRHFGTLTNGATTGEVRYGFESMLAGASGNFIDDVTINLPALVELKGFSAPSLSGTSLNESADDLFLELYVSGTLDVSAQLTFTVVAGSSASAGSDFSVVVANINRGQVTAFDNATGQVTLSLPAGNYNPNLSSGASSGLIRIPIVLSSDNVAESNKTLGFTEGTVSGGGSSAARNLQFNDASCDGVRVATTSQITIIDDDVLPTLDAVTSDSGEHVTATGTAFPGASVVVTFPDGSTKIVTADASGNYTITSTNRQPPGYVTMRAEDDDGNRTATLTESFIPDVGTFTCTNGLPLKMIPASSGSGMDIIELNILNGVYSTILSNVGSAYSLSGYSMDTNPLDQHIYMVVQRSGSTGWYLIRLDREGDFEWLAQLTSFGGAMATGGFDNNGRYYSGGGYYDGFNTLTGYAHYNESGFPTLNYDGTYNQSNGADTVFENGRMFELGNDYSFTSISISSPATLKTYTATWYDENGVVFNPSGRLTTSDFGAAVSYTDGAFWVHNDGWGIFKQEVDEASSTVNIRWVSAGNASAGDGLSCAGSSPFVTGDKSISGTVWFDADSNSLRNGGEAGINGVTVIATVNSNIVNAYGVTVTTSGNTWTTTTDTGGQYSLPGLVGTDGQSNAPAYTLSVTRPDPYSGQPTWFSVQNAGSDDTIDSDVDQSSGALAALSLTSSSATVDAGVVNVDTTITSMTADGSGLITASGRTTPGSAVTVTFPDGTTGTTTADASGNYSVTSANPIPNGGIISAESTLSGGSTTTAEALFLPEPTLTPGTDGSVIVSGRAPPSSSVDIVFPDGTTQTVTAAADGSYSSYRNFQPDGDVSVAATLGGVTSPPRTLSYTDTTPPDAPVIVTTTPEPSGEFIVTGTAEPDTTVSMLDEDGEIIGTCSPDPLGAAGTFTCNVPAGVNTLNLQATDRAGNSSALTLAPLDDNGVDDAVEAAILTEIADEASIKSAFGYSATTDLLSSPKFVALRDCPLGGETCDNRGAYSPVLLGLDPDDTCRISGTTQSVQEGSTVAPNFKSLSNYTVAQDAIYDYPFGMMAFGLDCAADGEEATITLVYTGFDKPEYADLDASDLVFRKFNQNTGAYSLAEPLVLEWQAPETPDIGGMRSLKAVFRVQDDGRGDEYRADGAAEGAIYDPIGPALLKSGIITLDKTVSKKRASIGDIVQYQLVLQNSESLDATDLSIRDRLPDGFKLMDNSVRIVDTSTGFGTPVAYSGTQTITINNLTILSNGKTVLRYSVAIGSGVKVGKKVNSARAYSDTGVPITSVAKAVVEVVSDPLLNDTNIIGKVFNDRNANGYQDDGEEGIAGVRLATVAGEWITTDDYGRYSYPSVNAGVHRSGRNFIIKLDERSLPEYASLISENPVVRRVTGGLMHKINFAVRLP